MQQSQQQTEAVVSTQSSSSSSSTDTPQSTSQVAIDETKVNQAIDMLYNSRRLSAQSYPLLPCNLPLLSLNYLLPTIPLCHFIRFLNNGPYIYFGTPFLLNSLVNRFR